MSILRTLRVVFGRNAGIYSPRWRIASLARGYGTINKDCKDGDNPVTMSEVLAMMLEKTALEIKYIVHPKSREHLLQFTPKLEDLPPRSLQDSFTSAYIPLQSSEKMQMKYITPLGHVRLGRLMEDMDLFAVWVCMRHLHIPNLDPKTPLPYNFVTILVDKCDFLDYVPMANKDIRLSGHVSWVGKSSLEVAVWLEQIDNGELKKITRAIFLMAARNATNTKAAPVNPLVPATEREKLIHSGGKKRSERRKRQQAISIPAVQPNEEEQTLMFDIFKTTLIQEGVELNARLLPENGQWMGETEISTTMACHPEHRNLHNTIFGGFLMRNALELSAICAIFHAKKQPKLEAICDIIFREPVSVAAYLKMSAHVVYTESNYIQVCTVANIMNPLTSEKKTTNVFSYTFRTEGDCPDVYPQTYDEMLWFIEGRRKFRYSMGIEGPKRGGIPE